MWLRARPNRKSLERDQSFTFSYGEKKYTMGRDPVEVPDEAAKYFLSAHSGQIELVPVGEIPTKALPQKRKRK